VDQAHDSLTTSPSYLAIAAPKSTSPPSATTARPDRPRRPCVPFLLHRQTRLHRQLSTPPVPLRKYQLLPVVAPGQAPRIAWRTLAQYRIRVGEPVKASKYQKIIKLLHRLNHIHPSLMPQEVRDAMEEYKETSIRTPTYRVRTVDHDGRAIGVGRRKSSTARVWLVEGEGRCW
jgi:hypothetical protein